ncbi:MAG: flippase-like domain-containing protein [Chlorobi bacterium]|nr:flippase-like domain-containing protein [Chlorobiota bacterium]
MQQREEEKSKKQFRFPIARVLQIILAISGLTFFTLLARKVDFGDIPSASLDSLPLCILIILGLLLVNYTFDTASWWIVCGEKRPSLWTLALIRLRCEAVTNVIPGGAVIGEPMKVGFLMNASGMTRAEATASFLLSKFVLILGQIVYIFVGLALSYTVINNVSESIFGVGDFAMVVLGGALAVLLIILTFAASMVLWQPMNRKFSYSERDGWIAHWWNIGLKELREIEALVAQEFRRHRYRLFLAILFSFIVWSLNGVELYFIVRWLGIDASFTQIYSIDAVSVVVRMVVFVIPIGLGGQDWTITGLVAAHGLPQPETTAARMVVMKRAREFFVIGLGLLLLLVMPRREERRKWASKKT